MDDNNIFSHLPQDILHQIFTRLSLQQVVICRSVNKHLYSALSSPSFTHLLATTSPFPLLALRPPHRHHPLPPSPLLHLFDPISHKWLRFPLNFLPFPSAHPIASAAGLLYLWADSGSPDGNKSLVVCNPLALRYKTLPQLGSAWSKHGSVLVDSVDNRVIVLNELALLYYSNIKNMWLKFSSNLPAKPRSPVLINKSIIALCDVGSPWRSQWKLFICSLKSLQTSQMWNCLERCEWGDVFDILKRPRLLKGVGDVVLMIGGLKSSFSLNASCSTILILKLDLGKLEWGEAGRMPGDMFRCFQESSKFKVFGGGNRVCFSGKRVGRLALWEAGEDGKEEWRWIDGVPGNGEGLYRGFLFDARLDAEP
ncbi:putative F-box domain, kelch-type beta propeller, F-box-like domain superfamily [Helianthus annuus]|nr:putative F-box domain, kelch-type beta propeller, F-box-like domain superfamily [Helianthus annuus]KAJ0939866.1 putative F-box domain, kelch-type beta propeller, F-box-like domain superfamily [Helianthus annuus]KAJ0951736.1 putative F-box domain, kelch-type beta propeller, F-box-like domain superfamily [Helianthus annuus]